MARNGFGSLERCQIGAALTILAPAGRGPGGKPSSFLPLILRPRHSPLDSMKFQDIYEMVKGVPFIEPENARYLYDLIRDQKLMHVLELGIAHGTATCYMAAALDELGGGHVDAVDLKEASQIFRPSAEEQLAQTGLASRATIHRMQTGYTWFLHDEIKRRTTNDVCEPKYDLCIIDGPKNWTIDGCAFFLADKLLKEGGWIIFDDYTWTYAQADAKRSATDGISHRSLSDEERKTPHIEEVFHLLVKQHPNYSEFVERRDRDWVAARKKTSAQKVYTVEYKETYRDVVAKFARRLKRTRQPAGAAAR